MKFLRSTPKSVLPSETPSAAENKKKWTCANGVHLDYKVVDDAVDSGDIAHYCPRCRTFWIYNIWTQKTVEMKYLPDHLAEKDR